jgi:hypothetical protein
MKKNKLITYLLIIFALLVNCQKKQISTLSSTTAETRSATLILSNPATQIFEVNPFLMDSLSIKITKQRRPLLTQNAYQGTIYLKSEKTGKTQWEKNVTFTFVNNTALIAEKLDLPNADGENYLLEFYFDHKDGESWLFKNNDFPLSYFIQKTPLARIGPSTVDSSLNFEFSFPETIAKGEYPVTFTFYKTTFNAQLQIDADKKGKLKFKVPLKLYADGVYPMQLKIFLADKTIIWENKQFSIEKFTIYTWQDLQAMEKNLAGNYILGQDIYMPHPDEYPANDSLKIEGFRPIGLCDNFQAYIFLLPTQVQNIDVTKPDILPYREGNPFTGTLDGKGFTIHNLYIKAKDWNGVGLFGVIDGVNAAVRNLKIEVNYINGQNLVGALAGFIRTSKSIKNVEISGTEKQDLGSAHIQATYYVGGLVGWASYKTLPHTASLDQIRVNAININGEGILGGVAGFSAADFFNSGSRAVLNATKDYLGGFLALGQNLFIQSCFVESKEIKGKNYVGGLVGRLDGNILVQGAYFDNTFSVKSVLTGESYVSGLVGLFTNASDNILKEVYVTANAGSMTTQKDGKQYWICSEETTRDYISSAFVNEKHPDYSFKNPDRILEINRFTTDKENKLKNLGFNFATRWRFAPNAVYPKFIWSLNN